MIDISLLRLLLHSILSSVATHFKRLSTAKSFLTMCLPCKSFLAPGWPGETASELISAHADDLISHGWKTLFACVHVKILIRTLVPANVYTINWTDTSRESHVTVFICDHKSVLFACHHMACRWSHVGSDAIFSVHRMKNERFVSSIKFLFIMTTNK